LPTGYQIKEQDKLYYVTLQIVGWIDIFTRKCYRNIIIENLAYCQKHKGLDLFGWVIMSNHIHLLARCEKEGLSNLLRDFKNYTSKKILKEIESATESRKEWILKVFKDAAFKHKRNSDYQVWTHENHAEILYSNEFIEQKLDYIHQNPVRSGIVEKAEEYRYSSARTYAELESLLEIIKLERILKSVK
jgi:REP element-mobilizing transposase RayT